MKREPTIDKVALIEGVRREYGLDIERLTFLPKGEVSYCYIAHCSSGDRYFLKLFDTSRLGLMSTSRLDFYLPLTWNLYFKGLFRNVPYPIKIRNGDFKTRIDGWPLVVFSFIEGKTFEHEHPLSDLTLATLAKMVAIIHKSTFKIGIEIPYAERFDIPFEGDLMNGLNALEGITVHDNQGKQALRDLLLPRKDEILGYLDRLRELKNLVRIAQKEMVLCHTDLTGGNLMVDDQGDLYILDWEGAKLAPPEHDLFFFTGEPFDLFLANYEREFGPVSLDSNVFGFYLYRRNLEDLTDWIIRILHENTDDDEQNRNDLKGIAEDCISGWPYLEATIRDIDTKLVQRGGGKQGFSRL